MTLEIAFSLIQLIFFSVFILQAISFDDGSCNRCVDAEGNSCDETMRRFAATKYWVPKDDSPMTFSDAVEFCSQNGFMVAEITSPGDQATFETLAKYAGHEQYWIGAMNNGDGLKTPDNVALAWQPPIIFGSGDDGDSAVSVDLEGNWNYSASNEMRGAVCQYPWNHPCFQEHLKSISGRVDPIGNLHDPNNDDCDEPFYQKTQFIRTGPNSKYLMPKELFYVSHIQAYATCRQLGLEPAVIVFYPDWVHLSQQVVDAKQLYKQKFSFRFALGAFDVHEEGVFTELTSNRSVTFQGFNLENRNDYYDELKNCLSMECGRKCFYASQFCNEPRTSVPLCQYKRESLCYQNSIYGPFESQLDRLPLIRYLDSTTRRDYFTSRIQTSFSEAKRICALYELQLLDFIKGDFDETNELKEVIQYFTKEANLQRGFSVSWTSGIFPNGYGVGKGFQFGNGVLWDFDENEGHWDWLPELEGAGIRVQNEKEEKCILLIGGGDRRTPLFARPVVCNLQNLFICYAERAPGTDLPKTTMETTTTTETSVVGGGLSCSGKPVKISFDPTGLTTEEVEELIKDSQKYNFSMDYADGMKIREESAWRLPHVKGMGWITQKICPDEHVPREYVNLLMNFIMIFYHNAKDDKMPDGISAKIWETMGKMYAKCGEETESIEMRAVGGLAKYYQGEDGDEYPIYVEEEIYDSYEYLDLVMEGMWFMHQLTAAACYKVAESKSRWVTDYHLAFRNDWTEVLKEWWVQPSESNYGLLFGDMELHSAIVNLRSCAQVAFTRLGIQDRMFPRPLTLDNEEGLVGGDLNSKIGHELVL